MESKQWKWPGKQMEPKSLGEKNNQVTAALVGTQLPTAGKDTELVLVKMWHKRNWSNKVQEATETILLNVFKR